MKRQVLMDAIKAFNPKLAQQLEYNRRSYTNVKHVVGEICMHIIANNITSPEEPLSTIRLASQLIIQQGNNFTLEEEDHIEQNQNKYKIKKEKQQEKYTKSITTPILTEQDKTKILTRNVRKIGHSTKSMLGYVAPFPHRPLMWGATWHSVPNTKRIVITMINLGIVEIVEYSENPLYTVIQRGPRWNDYYSDDIVESWQRIGGMQYEKQKYS